MKGVWQGEALFGKVTFVKGNEVGLVEESGVVSGKLGAEKGKVFKGGFSGKVYHKDKDLCPLNVFEKS